jgi:NAD(P) transhydrogenase subunit alpha
MIFVGIEVIGRVPSVLHTPLMSGANAIHGVVIIGAIIVMGRAEADNYAAMILGFLAVLLGTLNVVGGFVVTDRMLEMFRKKEKPKK